MSDPRKRIEKTHIDEVTRTATSSVQWFLEKRNIAGTHPITHNNALSVFTCGEESFADIAAEIKKAKASIDIICWGFDPGMELIRDKGAVWPRGDCYGDLLIAAAKRHIQVRLLVWYDATLVGPANQRNMPGYTHGTRPWFSESGATYAEKISAENSVLMLNAYCKRDFQLTPVWNAPNKSPKDALFPIKEKDIPLKAREEYCHSWYDAASHGLLELIDFRTRNGSAKHIETSLVKDEKRQSAGQRAAGLERAGMIHGGTHHQKTILIDFAHDEGKKAVGYVMGLNSLTDYWDTAGHRLEDNKREQGTAKETGECVQGKETDPGFHTLKPYRDYACRIDGGGALISLYKNFVTAWDRAADDRVHTAANACTSREQCDSMPTALLRKADKATHSTVQIVRTQPEEQDTSIKDIYFQAAAQATNAVGYLYLENQYFQCEEWTQYLRATREGAIKAWDLGRGSSGKSLRKMPIMHVFIVIPVPERVQMVPRTYDALATLGQQEGMTGQGAMIRKTNEEPNNPYDASGPPIDEGWQVPPEVIEHANSIDKPDVKRMEDEFGLKVCTAMLNTCGLEGGRWRYREIYIHSKLLLVDDTFFTLGSANLNQRSMAVDSELNLATDDHHRARDLRRRIWSQLSGGEISGGGGTRQEIVESFDKWTKLMAANKRKKLGKSESANRKKMTGFLLPLEDSRSSTLRLG
jgi:phosphatidylserine/phosphatidylglycerophosphate/cardiolipin synthase-like enzyme